MDLLQMLVELVYTSAATDVHDAHKSACEHHAATLP